MAESGIGLVFDLLQFCCSFHKSQAGRVRGWVQDFVKNREWLVDEVGGVACEAGSVAAEEGAWDGLSRIDSMNG